jgi:hypothetical protein
MRKVGPERETPHWCEHHRGSNVLRRGDSGSGLFRFPFVAVMGMSGGDAGQPTSVAIAGTGVAGGCSLLILASVTVCLAIGVLKLREWADRIHRIQRRGNWMRNSQPLRYQGVLCVLPPVPSIIVHLLVVSKGVCTLAYLCSLESSRLLARRPRNWLSVEFLVASYGHIPTASNL